MSKLYNIIHKRYIPTRVYMEIRENFSSRNTQEYWTRVKPAWTERILLRHRTKAHTHPHIIYIQRTIGVHVNYMRAHLYILLWYI